MRLSFERDAELSFDGGISEIEDWHRANPNPADADIFDRLAWRMARQFAPDEFGVWLWRMWIESGKVGAESAARKAIPYMDEVFGEDRKGFAEWVGRWFIERGVGREVCVEALSASAAERDEEVAAS